MILYVKLFLLIYDSAILNAEDSSHFQPYTNALSDDTFHILVEVNSNFLKLIHLDKNTKRNKRSNALVFENLVAGCLADPENLENTEKP